MEGHLEQAETSLVRDVWERNWGGLPVVTASGPHLPEQVVGRVLSDESGEVAGLVTWLVNGNDAEIVTVDAFVSGSGVGKRLIALAEDELRAQGVRRVTVVALQGAVQALGFYIKCGYRHHTVHEGALDAARDHKFVPELDSQGTPNHDMWGFEKVLG